MTHNMQIIKYDSCVLATPQRELDAALEYMDEIRTINELNEVLADRHRVKMNSLMSM